MPARPRTGPTPFQRGAFRRGELSAISAKYETLARRASPTRIDGERTHKARTSRSRGRISTFTVNAMNHPPSANCDQDDEAARQYQASPTIAERLGDQAGMATSYSQMGILEAERDGDLQKAHYLAPAGGSPSGSSSAVHRPGSTWPALPRTVPRWRLNRSAG
jgi:hypothetical protein